MSSFPNSDNVNQTFDSYSRKKRVRFNLSRCRWDIVKREQMQMISLLLNFEDLYPVISLYKCDKCQHNWSHYEHSINRDLSVICFRKLPVNLCFQNMLSRQIFYFSTTQRIVSVFQNCGSKVRRFLGIRTAHETLMDNNDYSFVSY